eukprot:CAMPEP_0203659302 /NCGR_PEP_ID=MMETSP0088-20131115/51466_1 /ASSEMBLY_ACC=CAM_ASM_001087 /TAXON_ID=426623 /ORGANISM="Chaetoceros affinis, Strain CCMP159" /LENGTH=270 /DNA_ID=CAMNT_0050521287 /DNA_START=268 /DNA_END=1080 /DNA_ORIENTATION=-
MRQYILASLLLLFPSIGAFTVLSNGRETRASTFLSAEESGDNSNHNDEKESQISTTSRRDVLKSSYTAAAAAVAFNLDSQPVFAEEEGSGGKLIEFNVENLGGEPGNTGRFVVKTNPDWAPNGVKRFEKLTEVGFWNDERIFRVLPNFIGQFGINGDPSVQALWRSNIPDDPVKVGNTRGTVVFATAGPNTRTTQIFINTGNNNFLDRQGFSPIGEVVEGMDVVDKFYSGYGEGAPRGKGPNQGLIQAKGNAYLEKDYPKLSYFSSVKFL